MRKDVQLGGHVDELGYSISVFAIGEGKEQIVNRLVCVLLSFLSR